MSLSWNSGLLRNYESQNEIEKEEYINLLHQLIDELNSNGLKKLVLSRSIFVRKDIGDQIFHLVSELADLYPDVFIYLFAHPLSGIWIGASPETLLEGNDGSYRTMSLAGTRANAKNIEWGQKEREEQQMVSDFILDQLRSAGVKTITENGPYNKGAGTVTHLCTEFDFKFDQSVEKILNALHPTPAVCGLPREKARKRISELEKWDRAYYTGYFGTVDNQGNYRYFVNLRCAQLFSNGAKIYVGGGILAESDAEAEWLETEMKSKTILSALKKL
jgi:isochorismate synthase